MTAFFAAGRVLRVVTLTASRSAQAFATLRAKADRGIRTTVIHVLTSDFIHKAPWLETPL